MVRPDDRVIDIHVRLVIGGILHLEPSAELDDDAAVPLEVDRDAVESIDDVRLVLPVEPPTAEVVAPDFRARVRGVGIAPFLRNAGTRVYCLSISEAPWPSG